MRLVRKISLNGLIVSSVLAGASGVSHGFAQVSSSHGNLPVRLCTSVPLGFPARRAISQGVANGVILATEQWKTRFRAKHLALLKPVIFDDARGARRLDTKREEQVARICVRRHDTFGYVGPLQSPLAMVSEPILNRAAMVQIGPATTSILLTSRLGRATLEPATFAHRLAYVTFYRDITTDAMQGPSDAAYLRKDLHVRTYFAVDDGVTYSAGLMGLMEQYGSKIGLQLAGTGHIDPTSPSALSTSVKSVADSIVARHPDGVLYAADIYGGLLPKLLREKGYHGPLVSGDTILDPAFINGAGPGIENVFASRVGPDVLATSSSFRRAYRQRFHVATQEFDALAYDAADVELNAIFKAASQNTFGGNLYRARASILPYVAHTRWKGAIGKTSFDKNGDNRNRIVEVYSVRNGNWSYLSRAPNVQGVTPAGG